MTNYYIYHTRPILSTIYNLQYTPHTRTTLRMCTGLILYVRHILTSSLELDAASGMPRTPQPAQCYALLSDIH